MMDELIYRQDAIDEVNNHRYVFKNKHLNDYEQGWNDACDYCADEWLEQLPSARRKGHWRNYEGTLTCSVCEAEFDNGIMEYCGDDVPMFCPNCGADMRGEEDR